MASNLHGCGTSRRIASSEQRQTMGRIHMRNQNPLRSTQFSFPMSKCAVALLCSAFLCSAFLIEPLCAQTLNWPYYGADVYNTRYANIDQINPTNVSQLKPAWTFHTGVFDSNMTME